MTTGNTAGQVTAGSVETMLQSIMGMLEKSQLDMSELKQECAELRHSNYNLERQLREGLQSNNNHNGYRTGTPGFMTPIPSSPQIRAKVLSPFLSSPQNIPGIAITQPLHALPTHHASPLGHPSPLGDNASYLSYNVSRDIPGFYVVIPAGGAGTRLWPLSREGHPKFLLDLTLSGRSLIQATWDRLLPLTSAARTTVVAGPAHVKGISEQLPELLADNIFCESSPKDSMAAIGLAAAILVRRDPDAIIGSFAADHMISGDDAFLSAVAEAVEVARQDYLVTIGIAPSHPSTGFGYIRLGEKLENVTGAPSARAVREFVEKPDARRASEYLATGKYRWNAGMFVTKARVLLDLLSDYQPEMAEGLEKIGAVWDDEGARQRAMNEIWPGLLKIPIDNAVAEPAARDNRVAVVPATFGWDDVGDFSSLADLLPAEANKTRVLGDSNLVLTSQVAGGIVVPGTGRLISCLGVDDLVIVDMPDTLLVTTRARCQEVKSIVRKAREAGWAHLL